MVERTIVKENRAKKRGEREERFGWAVSCYERGLVHRRREREAISRQGQEWSACERVRTAVLAFRRRFV